MKPLGTCLAYFSNAAFSGIFFQYESTPSGSTGKYTFKKLFMYVVITSCKSVAVSVSGAELVLGGNLLCNVLMACYSLSVFYI